MATLLAQLQSLPGMPDDAIRLIPVTLGAPAPDTPTPGLLGGLLVPAPRTPASLLPAPTSPTLNGFEPIDMVDGDYGPLLSSRERPTPYRLATAEEESVLPSTQLQSPG